MRTLTFVWTSAATNDYFVHFRLICRSFSWLIDYLLGQQNVRHWWFFFPKTQGDVLKCLNLSPTQTVYSYWGLKKAEIREFGHFLQNSWQIIDQWLIFCSVDINRFGSFAVSKNTCRPWVKVSRKHEWKTYNSESTVPVQLLPLSEPLVRLTRPVFFLYLWQQLNFTAALFLNG